MKANNWLVVVAVLLIAAAVGVGQMVIQQRAQFVVINGQMVGGQQMEQQGGPVMQAEGVAPSAGGAAAASLHLPHDRRASLPIELNDSANMRWDIQGNGAANQGTNWAFSGAMNLTVNNSGIPYNGGAIWQSRGSDEIELTANVGNSINVSRRVKVYKDQPLARWIDIFENASDRDQTLQIQQNINYQWQLTRLETTDGNAEFGPKDWALMTECQQGNNSPDVLIVMCDPRSKLRPTVQVASNSVVWRYSVVVPAHSSTALCTFLSQGSTADHKRMLQGFRFTQLLSDLPVSARKLIANIANIVARVDLERAEDADKILKNNGDPIKGVIKNENFTLDTFYGKITIAAKDIVGMAAGGEDEPFRALLADGQVIRGKLLDPKITMELPSKNSLQIPVERIAQWSYRISDAKPDDAGAVIKAAMLVLRSGDQIAFDPSTLKLDFRTPYGVLPVKSSDLLEVNLDNGGNGVHKAVFTNGSTLGGFLEPEKLELTSKLGQKLKISRNLISQIRFPNDERPDVGARLTLTNGDVLMGDIADKDFVLISDENPNSERTPANQIKNLNFSSARPGFVVLETWTGTQRGMLDLSEIKWQITPGPTMTVPLARIASIARTSAAPTEEVEKLILQLGSESYAERQAATENLSKKAKEISGQLRQHLNDPDPEVRQRIMDLLQGAGENITLPQPSGRMGRGLGKQ